MILYRCMTQYSIDKGFECGIFKPTHVFSQRLGGNGRINNESCFNTFTADQNINLHFFQFAIDAISYMDSISYQYDGLKLCKFDIPDNLIEKGYGFYLYNIRSEFVAKKLIPSNCLIKVIEECSNQELLAEIISNLDEAIYWHSTAGKATTICVNDGIMDNICGDNHHGGFMRIYSYYLDECLRTQRFNISNDFINDCLVRNQEAYDNSTILDDIPYISQYFHHDYWQGLDHSEINKLFNGLEELYINKTIKSISEINYKNICRKKE